MHRLFGTDGVRGKAGEYPLDHETVARLGGALVRAMRRTGGSSPLRLVVGRDTRESGEWIERELARGVHAAGAEITSAGIIPTPAIAFVTREMGFDAGLVISASHNPFEDNGIKVFSGAGEKFTETHEREVESIDVFTPAELAENTVRRSDGGLEPALELDRDLLRGDGGSYRFRRRAASALNLRARPAPPSRPGRSPRARTPAARTAGSG